MFSIATGARSLPLRILAASLSISFLYFLYLTFRGSGDSHSILPPHLRPDTSGLCSPHAYVDGQWLFHPKTNDPKMRSADDALRFSGFQGCASSREYYWHLAADKEEQWDRFPAAQSWRWQPGRECIDLRRFDAQEVITHLVEEGGWLLVGDSVTEQHFFSLSCLLYPHVLGFPNYTEHDHDRATVQHLFLNPQSPIVKTLRPPKDFDIKQTPLASFRRVDLLFSQQELVDIYRSTQRHIPNDFKLFGDEATWTLSPSVYLEQFTAPLPTANYRTMIVSTGGHWTTTMFQGLRDENNPKKGYGIDKVLDLFKVAVLRWANEAQTTLRAQEKGNRRIVVRAYLPGHEDCHQFRQPWTEIQPFVFNWFNWGSIWEFNKIFEKILSSKRSFPDIHFLPIDRPARLRPDAHATSDCLHIMTGAGVIEGWSEYIWHYITREV